MTNSDSPVLWRLCLQTHAMRVASTLPQKTCSNNACIKSRQAMKMPTTRTPYATIRSWGKFGIGLAAATKPKPTVRAPREENVRHSQLSREQTSSGKFLIRDDLFSKTCGRHSLSLRHIFRESD